MGKDNKKTILNLLHTWRTIVAEETEALADGDLDRVEFLNNKTVSIQAHLDEIFSDTGTAPVDTEILESMQQLRACTAALMAGLVDSSRELSEKIGTLRKNKNSLKGYKQKRGTPPRFMNERA